MVCKSQSFVAVAGSLPGRARDLSGGLQKLEFGRRSLFLSGRAKDLKSGLQKLEFCRCSLFPSWSGLGLISTPVDIIKGK